MEIKAIEFLASTLGRKDEKPNVALADLIVRKHDLESVQELLTLLTHKQAGVRSDAIKVLYEIGERDPAMIAASWKIFIHILKHKDNRMRWGAMSALASISMQKAEVLAKHLSEILEAMDSGTVITRDKGVTILANISRLEKYHADAIELLLEQIERAPVNQVNQYAEKTAAVISAPFKMKLVKILSSRHDVMEYPPKKKKLEKLINDLATYKK